MLLDATAGNRGIWPNKAPPLTVFIDKELGLRRPPDIFADNRFCPFRDHVFETIIYDPPHFFHSQRMNKSVHSRPDTKGAGSWWGCYISRLEMVREIHQAGQEFLRIGRRLCLKWTDYQVSLWSLIPLLKPWKLIFKKGRRSRSGISNNIVWWATFTRDKKVSL